MSLAGRRANGSHVWCLEGRGLYNEVRCIMGNGHMGTPPLWTERHEWKHCLQATLMAGGNDDTGIITIVTVVIDLLCTTRWWNFEVFKLISTWIASNPTQKRWIWQNNSLVNSKGRQGSTPPLSPILYFHAVFGKIAQNKRLSARFVSPYNNQLKTVLHLLIRSLI